MRVLHVLPGIDAVAGGPAFSVPELCQAMADAGDDVVLFTSLRNGRSPSPPAARATFPIRCFRPLPSTSEFPSPAFCKGLADRLPQFPVAVLHSVWNPVTTVAGRLCLRGRVPYLLRPLGMLRSAAADRKSLKKALYYSLVDRKIFEGCACILCFNETDAAESRRFVPASKPVLILPNGVNGVSDPPSAAAFRRLYPALQGKRILLFLGRLHWSKNLALQLEAFSRLALRFPDLVWVLIGPDAGEAATLRKDIDLRNLSARVLFTGSLDNAICQDALAAADVVLLTSHHEGHSMAMNETLAAGAPLVMTSTVGFDAAGAAGAALIVPPDAARLVRAVSSILDNPALSSQMARAAREFASRHLAWPQIAGRLRAILQRILDGRALSEFEGFNPFQSAISSQV